MKGRTNPKAINPPGPSINGKKTCTRCMQKKLVSEFYKEKQNLSGYRSWCKTCSRLESKRRYDTFDDSKRFNMLRIARKTELKKTLIARMGGCCSKCGYNRSIYALEFHHVGEGKEHNISDLLIKAANANDEHLKRLETEIAKCILLCANCHRELHAGEL